MPNQLEGLPEPKLNYLQQFLKHILGVDQQTNEARHLQLYGPQYAPPVTEEIPGYALKRFTPDLGLQNFPSRPYYVQPGVGEPPNQTAPESGYYEPGRAAKYTGAELGKAFKNK